MARHILIVDDEQDICEILRFNLEMEGYVVSTSEGPVDLFSDEWREKGLPNLILLDVMMTPKSGFEWARELKSDSRTENIPIVFCTAKTMEEDMLRGFAIGSDDYICKPFRISEVKARVKAVMRRMTPERDEAMGVVLDHDSKVCYVDGEEIELTKLEFELLALLMSKPGQVFSREKILQTVWPSDTIVLDRTVDVNVTRIRKKIGRYGKYLRTKFGYGYLFNG
ncbi:MAG: response regulator transcription factor [Prevotella sp.]|nr:response regulator transcription factor [Candidatus Prevotella equi]